MSNDLELLGKIQEGIDGLSGKADDHEKQLAELGAVKQEVIDLKERAEINEEATRKEQTELRTLLEHQTSVGEADDHIKDLSQFFNEVFRHQRFGEDFSDHVKAAADFVTTTDATAGYLVPSLSSPAIVAAHQLYGHFLPMTTRYTAAGGVTLPVNARTSYPVATWGTQGTAMTETEFVYAQDTVTPKRLSLYIKASNEMLAAPDTGFTEDVTASFLEAIVKAKEVGMLQGDADGVGDGTDPPSDGVFVAASTSDQTNISANTVAALMTFVAESITDNNELYDTNMTKLFTHPAKFYATLAQIGATSNNGLLTISGDGRARIAGYELIAHPGCLVGSTYWGGMFRPKDLIVADSMAVGIDFNAFGTGWTSYETWVRAVTHCDWSLGGINSRFSKADYA